MLMDIHYFITIDDEMDITLTEIEEVVYVNN